MDALIHGDVPALHHLDRACKALSAGQEVASISGQQLAQWRWRKPGLVHEVEHWREQLQLPLGLDAAPANTKPRAGRGFVDKRAMQ
ncbi:ORF11CD3 domain protein [compost metagenome]